MEQKIEKQVLNNGMVLLGEPMTGVESVAFDFMMPAGVATLPEGVCGAANVAADWIFRGAGSRDSRALGDALDGLGLHRSDSVGSAHLSIGAVLESSNLAAALSLYADAILAAHLSDEQFVPARQLALEGVLTLADEPRQMVMLELRKRFCPSPLGRSTLGEIEELDRLTAEQTRQVCDLLRRPPAEHKDLLLHMLQERVPPYADLVPCRMRERLHLWQMRRVRRALDRQRRIDDTRPG